MVAMLLRQMQLGGLWLDSVAAPQRWGAAVLRFGALPNATATGGGLAQTRAVAVSISPPQWAPFQRHSFWTSSPPQPTPPPPSPPEYETPPAADPQSSESPKEWPMVRRFAVESAVKSYGGQTLADSIFVLHGPRGVGKRTAVKAVLQQWASPPHVVAHVDLYAALSPTRSHADPSPPWLNQLYPEVTASPSSVNKPSNQSPAPLSSQASQSEETASEDDAVRGLTMSASQKETSEAPVSVFHPRVQRVLRSSFEHGVLGAVKEAVMLKRIKMEDIFWALTWKRQVDAALERHLADGPARSPDSSVSFRRLKSPAGTAYAELASAYDFFERVEEDALTKDSEPATRKVQPRSKPDPQTARLWLEALINVPAVVKKRSQEPNQTELALRALHLAREVLEVQEEWRTRRGGRGAADAATAWSVLLIDLLSAAAEEGKFEPKLVVHGIELLRQAPKMAPSRRRRLRHDVSGALFHDQLVLRLTERFKTLPVILTASDGYYATDIDEEQKFLRTRIEPSEYFGWSEVEAAVHLVPRLLSPGQSARLRGAVGLNARHLAEFHSRWAERAAALTSAEREAFSEESPFAQTVKEYLGELEQRNFRPVMQDVVRRVAERGRKAWGMRRSRWRGVFGQWDDVRWKRWAMLQVLDLLRALERARFGVNYVNLAAGEFLEDEVARALMSAGLLYKQRDPPYVRPVTKAFQDLMETWLREQWVELPVQDKIAYAVLRLTNGRYYRHLVKPSLGPKEFVMGEYRYV